MTRKKGLKEIIDEIDEELQRNKAYLEVIDQLRPSGRKRFRSYYRGRNEALRKQKAQLKETR